MTLGQFGSSSDSVSSTATFKTFTLGSNLRLGERVKLGFNASYVTSDEGMSQLLLGVPADVLAKLKFSSYDLDMLHTYSDLASRQWDVSLRGEAKITPKLSGVASYSFLEYHDASPYLEDLTGTLGLASVGLKYSF